MNYCERFKVAPGSKVKLKEIDPSFKGGHENHKAAEEEIAHYQQKLRELQDLLYSERKHSLLICLQALDTGGKDGVINHVLGAMNPQGCRVAAFKAALGRGTEPRLSLARTQGRACQRRSCDFQPLSLRRCADRPRAQSRSQRRLVPPLRSDQRIRDGAWSSTSTQILKFYLHISKEEQLKRFKERLDDPSKHWKISEADYKERDFLGRLHWPPTKRRCHVAAQSMRRGSSSPPNHKWFRNLAIARIVVEHLESLKMKYPKPTVDIEHIRREYHAAKRR